MWKTPFSAFRICWCGVGAFSKKKKNFKSAYAVVCKVFQIVCISENNHVKFTIPFLFGFRILRVDGESVENPMGREFFH